MVLGLVMVALTGVWSFADSGDALSFCHFGPKMKVLSVVIDANGCSGNARVQGVLWECTAPERTEATVDSMRRRLTDQAREECMHHCERRGPDCTARFMTPKKCGLGTNREDAVVMGKREGCRSDCGGRAMVYCSLYDAGFRTEDRERTDKQLPNCYCARK